MDWELVLKEWPTVLGACGITFIVTQFFMGRLHQTALREQHNVDRDRMIRQHVQLLYAVQRRLACEIFERAPDLYISALKSMSADVERVLSEGEEVIKKRIDTLEDEARELDLLDGPSAREIVSAKEEFAMTANDGLVFHYHLIASLYFLHRRKSVHESNLAWALEKKLEREDANLLWRIKRSKAEYEAFKTTLDRLWSADKELADKVNDVFLGHSPILYEGSDFKVYHVQHPASWSVGFAFDKPAEFGVVEVFTDDKTYTSFYRSDRSFEVREGLRNQFGTTVTFSDRMDETLVH